MEQIKTGGGGKADIHALTSVEERIISILPTSIDGGPSVWDSDKLSESCNKNATCNNVLAEIDLNQIDNIYDNSSSMEMNSPTSAHDMESQVEYIDEEYLEDTKQRKRRKNKINA